MNKALDIVPLRSLIAIADSGGFHRAVSTLALTQSAVSQHVRRLEAVLGTPLVEPRGRSTRFTPAGEALLTEARRIIDAHDQALRRLSVAQTSQLVIGATEHAADHLLPPIMTVLKQTFPELNPLFRFDRTRRLNESLDRGTIDVAIFVAEASQQPGTAVGTSSALVLVPELIPPPEGEPLPLVAIQEPCAIRSAALRTLAEHGIPSVIAGDAAYLGGTLNAARAGLGITLLALAGPPPDGLIERIDMPPVPPVHLDARARDGADQDVTAMVLDALRSTLARVDRHDIATPAEPHHPDGDPASRQPIPAPV